MRHWLVALVSAAAMITLPLISPAPARADEAAGTILSIDARNGLFTLEDGTEFQLAGDISPEQLVIGMEVLVTYATTETGGLYATALEILD